MPSQTGPIKDSGKAAAIRDFFLDFPLTHDPDYYRLFDDFMGIAVDSTNDWTVVKDSSATVAIETDTLGGRLLMSSQASTADDGSSIQGNEIFLPVAGKDIWFETKLAILAPATAEFFAGLSVNWGTNPEGVLTVTDRIGFEINDADASILCITEDTNTPTSSDSEVDAVISEDIILGFHVIGTAEVRFFVNRVQVVSHTTNIAADQNFAVALMELSGTGGTPTQTMAVDYVMCVATR